MIKIIISTPDFFSFKSTLYSHGWSELAPFKFDDENLILKCVINYNENKKIPISIYESDDDLIIETALDLDFKEQEKVISNVKHILRFDDDLRNFYELIKQEADLEWIATENAGRLIRSLTVFEDLVKTVCTTNCSWALTKNMTFNLVEKLGESATDGSRAFPTAEKMASVSPQFYREEIRAGYRSPYFAEIAEQVASGKINPEEWLTSDLPTAELKIEMKKLKGVGDYAAENLLKLVGRYDGLALDSMLRKRFYDRHNSGNTCDDKQIYQFYERFGKWRGLVIWCEMSKK